MTRQFVACLSSFAMVGAPAGGRFDGPETGARPKNNDICLWLTRHWNCLLIVIFYYFLQRWIYAWSSQVVSLPRSLPSFCQSVCMCADMIIQLWTDWDEFSGSIALRTGNGMDHVREFRIQTSRSG